MASSISRRRGASFVEMIGCLVALGGGLTIGAMYLGVDLKGVCASALKSADVAAPEWLADSEQAVEIEADQASAGALPVSAEAAADDATNLASAKASAGSVTDASGAPAAAPMTLESARQRRRDSLGYLVPLTDQQKAVLTLAYWDELSEVIAAEEESRRACIDDACNLQLFDYLTARRNAHEAAGNALDELDLDGVDPHVLSFAEKVHTWHREGQSLFGRAIDLLTDAPSAQLTGPFAQSWQSAATQHRMEERLLVEKRAAVQTFLDHNLPGHPVPVAESAATR